MQGYMMHVPYNLVTYIQIRSPAKRMQELLPVHDAQVRREEARGAVVPGPIDGDHDVRGAAHAPQPRQPPRRRCASLHVKRARRAATAPDAVQLRPPGPDEHDAPRHGRKP